jgi:hypothetical protein
MNMWAAIIKGIEIAIGAGGFLWSIFGTNTEAEEARRRADIWFNWFYIAVIVIAVLAFIIWRKHRSTAQAIEKPEGR